MKIDHAYVSDLRPSRRPVLNIVLEEMPEAYGEVLRKTVGNQDWTVGQHSGHLCEIVMSIDEDPTFDMEKYFGLSPSGYFNYAFPELGPHVDVELWIKERDVVQPLDDQFYVMKLSKARTILRRHEEGEWSYYMSDFDGQRGLTTWEPIERQPTCKYGKLYMEHAHAAAPPGKARVTVNGIQYPLCSEHLTAHNQRQAERRRSA